MSSSTKQAISVPLSPPTTRALGHILPAEPLLLMGAGPVPIPSTVARANGVIIDHLGETMDRVIQGLKAMGRYAFQTETDKVLGVAGASSAAIEMGVSNLCWPGRKVLALVCGTFSNRLSEMALGVGADVTILRGEGHRPVTAEQVKDALAKDRYDVLTMVQGETSCGVLTVDLPEIATLARAHGALTIADTVCTLTTMPMHMDAWGIDVAITGGQKGLSSIPGVSIIAFSERAWDAVESRPQPRPHWCYDALRAQRFWGDHSYHYTAPVPGILAMYEALRIVAEETLPHRFARHLRSSKALQQGLEVMGLELFVPESYRLNSVVAIKVPDGIDPSEVRRLMRETFGVQISGAFGLNIIRIGQMGEQCRPRHLFRVLYALGESMRRCGHALDVSQGMATVGACLEQAP